MKGKKIIGLLLSLMFLVALAGNGVTREPYPAAGSGGAIKANKKIIIKGKVNFQKGLGGYFISSEDPSGKFIIVNPNPVLLEELKKTGKTVLIEGYLTMGANHLFIGEIDGKPYLARRGTPYPATQGAPNK